jgi:hypothetical protein
VQLVWLFWAVGLTIVTLASARMVNRSRGLGFAALLSFYVLYLSATQLFGTRTVVFDLGFCSFYAPSGVFIYPFIGQAVDMINETYGKEKARFAISIALLSQIVLMLFFAMGKVLVPSPFFQYEEAYQSIFSFSFRVTFASWISFFISQNIDAYVFSWLKKKYERMAALRSIASDAIDLTVDSAIFVVIAFYGVEPIIPLLIGQIVSKNVISFIDTPWFLAYRRMVSKTDISGDALSSL